MRLAKDIGANQNKFMGTRTNITFLGKGPTRNPLFQGPVSGIEAEVAAGEPSKRVISAIEDAMGYATSGKLNDIQLQALTLNLERLYKTLNPPPAFMGWRPKIIPPEGKAQGGLAGILAL